MPEATLGAILTMPPAFHQIRRVRAPDMDVVLLENRYRDAKVPFFAAAFSGPPLQ